MLDKVARIIGYMWLISFAVAFVLICALGFLLLVVPAVSEAYNSTPSPQSVATKQPVRRLAPTATSAPKPTSTPAPRARPLPTAEECEEFYWSDDELKATWRSDVFIYACTTWHEDEVETNDAAYVFLWDQMKPAAKLRECERINDRPEYSDETYWAMVDVCTTVSGAEALEMEKENSDG